MSLNTEIFSRPVNVANEFLRGNVKEALPISAIRLMAKARYAYLQVRMPLTFGAAVALTDPQVENIVLVQNTYSDPDLWTLPGGRIKETKTARKMTKDGIIGLPMELFEPSARKELGQEVGVNPAGLEFNHLMKYMSRPHGNLDRAEFFHATTDLENQVFRPQRSEIRAIEVFNLSTLPGYRAPYMDEVVCELQKVA